MSGRDSCILSPSGTPDYRESERRRQKERKRARGVRQRVRGVARGDQQQWGGQRQWRESQLSNSICNNKPSLPFSISSLQHGRAPHRSTPTATPTLYSRAQPMHLTSKCDTPILLFCKIMITQKFGYNGSPFIRLSNNQRF